MESKTVLQELLKELEIASRVGENPFIKTTLNLVIDMVESKLEKEKKQIIEACMEFSNHGKEMSLERAEQYYKETYEVNT